MTKIDLNNGKFFLNGKSFQSEIDTEVSNSHIVGKNLYSNLSMDGTIKEFPLKAIGYYKNKRIKSVRLTLKQEYLNKKFPGDIDFSDFLTHYLDFWKNSTEELLNKLLNTKKRRFEWGKVQVHIDPRGPVVYGEIKYY